MKKIYKYALVALVTTILILCTGCSLDDESTEKIIYGHFIVIEKYSYGTYLAYDPDTRVEYYVLRNGNYRGGISPVYNSDGSIKLYEEIN